MKGEVERSGGHISPFERIKRVNAAGNESWSSRDFAGVLGYADYRNFEQVIGKARIACFNSGQRVEDHFVDITEMIGIGKGGQREINVTLRQTIKELGGAMPETLPATESIKKLETRKKTRLIVE